MKLNLNELKPEMNTETMDREIVNVWGEEMWKVYDGPRFYFQRVTDEEREGLLKTSGVYAGGLTLVSKQVENEVNASPSMVNIIPILPQADEVKVAKYVPPHRRINKQVDESRVLRMYEGSPLGRLAYNALKEEAAAPFIDPTTPENQRKIEIYFRKLEYEYLAERKGIINFYNLNIYDECDCHNCYNKCADCCKEQEKMENEIVEEECEDIIFAEIPQEEEVEKQSTEIQVYQPLEILAWEPKIEEMQEQMLEGIKGYYREAYFHDALHKGRKEKLMLELNSVVCEGITTVVKQARIWQRRRKVAFPERKFGGVNYSGKGSQKESAAWALSKYPSWKDVYIGGVHFYEMRAKPEYDGRLNFHEYAWDVNLYNLGQLLKCLGYKDYDQQPMVHHNWRWEHINDGILNVASAILKDMKFPHDTEAEMQEGDPPESFPAVSWSTEAPQDPNWHRPGGNAGSNAWPNDPPITQPPVGYPRWEATVEKQGRKDDWLADGRRVNPTGQNVQAKYAWEANFDTDHRNQIHLMRQVLNHVQLGVRYLLGANDEEIWRLEYLRKIAEDSRQLLVDIQNGPRPSLSTIQAAVERINSDANHGVQGPSAGSNVWPTEGPSLPPVTIPPRPRPRPNIPPPPPPPPPITPQPGQFGMDDEERQLDTGYPSTGWQIERQSGEHKWVPRREAQMQWRPKRTEVGETSRARATEVTPSKGPQGQIGAAVQPAKVLNRPIVFQNPLGRDHEDRKFQEATENRTTLERGNVPLNESSAAKDNDIVHVVQRDIDLAEETERYQYSSKNPEQGWDAKEMLKRPILVRDEKWKAHESHISGHELMKVHLPEHWMKVGKERFNNHAARATFSHVLHRFDLCVRVHVNSNHFYGGRLVVCFDFMGQHTLSGRKITRSLASTMFNTEIDASVGNEAELIIPYENIAPYISNMDSWFDNGYLGTVYVIVQNRLSCPTTMASEVGVRMYVHAVDAELKVLRSWIPKAYPLPQVVEKQAREINHGKRATAGEFSLANVDDALYKLCLEDLRQNRSKGILSKYNENVRELCFKDSLLRSVDWNASNVVNSSIFTIPVHPCVAISRGDQTEIYHTIIEAVSNAYCYWRGSLNYRFTVSASQFHSGRLAVVYYPNVFNKTLLDSLKENWEQNPHMILDIKEKHENDFFVPYVSTRSWNLTSLHTTGGDFIATSTGYLQVLVLEPLVAPEAAAGKVELNCYISAGPDYELSVPRAILPDKEFAPMGVLQGMNDQFAEYQVIGRMDQIGRSPQDTIIEEHMNLHKLLMRYGKIVSRTGKANFFCFPVTPHLWAKNPEWKCHISWFSKFFTFWQGSLRYKISFRRNVPLLSSTRHLRPLFLKIWHDPTMTLPDGATDIIGKVAHSRSSGYGSQLIEIGVESVCEIEVPFYSQYDRLLIRRETHKREDKLPLLCSHNGCVCISSGDIVDINISVSVAAGPDFLFSVPNGVAPTKGFRGRAIYNESPSTGGDEGAPVLPGREYVWGTSSLDESPYENENNETVIPRPNVIPIPPEGPPPPIWASERDNVERQCQEWSVSNKERNKLAHSVNGNGSCFSVTVTIDNAPRYLHNDVEVKPRKYLPCLMSETEEAERDEMFYGVLSPPRKSDAKKRNKLKHSEEGNGRKSGRQVWQKTKAQLLKEEEKVLQIPVTTDIMERGDDEKIETEIMHAAVKRRWKGWKQPAIDIVEPKWVTEEWQDEKIDEHLGAAFRSDDFEEEEQHPQANWNEDDTEIQDWYDDQMRGQQEESNGFRAVEVFAERLATGALHLGLNYRDVLPFVERMVRRGEYQQGVHSVEVRGDNYTFFYVEGGLQIYKNSELVYESRQDTEVNWADEHDFAHDLIEYIISTELTQTESFRDRSQSNQMFYQIDSRLVPPEMLYEIDEDNDVMVNAEAVSFVMTELENDAEGWDYDCNFGVYCFVWFNRFVHFQGFEAFQEVWIGQQNFTADANGEIIFTPEQVHVLSLN